MIDTSDHRDVCQILKSRREILKDARAEWSVSEPKVICVCVGVLYMYMYMYVLIGMHVCIYCCCSLRWK